MGKRILLVGYVHDKHMHSFIKHFTAADQQGTINMDLFSLNLIPASLPQELTLVNDIYGIYASGNKDKKRIDFNFLRPLRNIYCLRKSLRQLKGRGKYDFINIQFLSFHSFFLFNLYRKISDNIMVTLYGSDVYCVNGVNRWFSKKVCKWSDYVSAPPIKFRDDIHKILNVPYEKFVNLAFGSNIISSLIVQFETYSKEDAKQKLGLGGMYTISCGYNGSPSQNHKDMIRAIKDAKNHLPGNLHIVLPFTYGASDEYRKEITSWLDDTGIPYTVFGEYLSIDDTALLRMASDVFIHMQKSDAFCASVQEYILAGATVINAKWLAYPDLEKYGTPYYTVGSAEELSVLLKEIPNHKEPPVITEELRSHIVDKGWPAQIKKWIDFYS